jgi:hypothetical protein
MRRELQCRSITTKLTESEYRKVAELGEKTGSNLSEFVRNLLVKEADKQAKYAEAEVLLGEILALRSVLLTLIFQLRGGRDMSEQQMRDLISQAEHDKYLRARERLQGPELNTQKLEAIR